MFKKLSLNETGTISNERNIFQLQSKKSILDVKDIPIRIQNGFINKYKFKKIIMFINKNTIKKIRVNKYFYVLDQLND